MNVMRFRTLQRVVAAVVSVPAAGVLAVVSYWLIADYLEARRQDPIDTETLDTLAKTARTDVSQTAKLSDLRERVTQRSLERGAWRQEQASFAIVSAVVFLVCAKWFVYSGGPPAPSLSQIQKHRGDGSASKRKRWRFWKRPKAGTNGQTDSPEIDLGFVDHVVAEEGKAPESAIPILQRIQTHYRYLPNEALERVCELTDITASQIAGVSSFYSQFRRSPVGRHIIKVCHGTACHVSGATEITEEVRRRLKIEPDSDTDPEKMFTVDEVACLGCCSLAPVIMIDETTAGNLTPASACEAVETYRLEHSE